MRNRVRIAGAFVLGLGLLAAAGTAKAVTIGSDARLTLPEFAEKTGQPATLFQSRYAATGMIVCSGVYSTAQLTLRNDVVTTAAHAFYDDQGNPRGDLSSCVFSVVEGGTPQQIPLVVSSLQVGSRNPYAVSPVFDWAVVRLADPVPKARPYVLGAPGEAGTSVVMLANRHRGWVHDGRKAIEACAIRDARRIDKINAREIAIDCSAGEGASGSALMRPGSTCAMVGIYVGWRSTHPDTTGPFSATHMNFGVAIEGPFRKAILAMTEIPANPPAPATASAGPAASSALR